MKRYKIITLAQNTSDYEDVFYILQSRYLKKSNRLYHVNPAEDILEILHVSFLNAMKDKEEYPQLLHSLEEFDSAYNEEQLLKAIVDERVNNRLEKGELNELINYLLVNTTSLTVAYFVLGLLTCILLKNIDEELMKTVQAYLKCKYFAEIVVEIYKNEDDYDRYAHEAHYAATDSEAIPFAAFYLNYNYRADEEIFARLEEAENIAEIDFAHEAFLDFELPRTFKKKKQLIEILKRNNNSLFYYDEVAALINDMDSFFEKESNVDEAINCIEDELINNYKEYRYYTNFIFTLLTRCKSYRTFCCALGLVEMIPYIDGQDEFYGLIYECTKNKHLVKYAVFALSKTPNYQDMMYKVASSKNFYIKMIGLNRLDLSIIKNYNLVRRTFLGNFIQPEVAYDVYNKLDVLKIVSDPLLNHKDVEFIRSLLENLSLVKINPLIKMVNNYKQVILKFYQNFVKTNYVDAHELNALLLGIFEKGENKDEDIASTILDCIIYEDEIGYIDELLARNRHNIDRVILMMKYYQYFPEYRLSKIFEKYPLEHIATISILALDSTNKETSVLHKCLSIVDEKVKVYLSHPHGEEENSDFNNTFSLLALSRIMEETRFYFSNIYLLGINSRISIVQLSFLHQLLAIKGETVFDDEIYDSLINIKNTSKSNDVLKIVNSLLNVDKAS